MMRSHRTAVVTFAASGLLLATTESRAGLFDDVPLPEITGAQGTMIRQHLDHFESPYSTPLSLRADGDTESTYTWGVYLGWEPLKRLQLYLDVEQFHGSGVSASTGLASLTDGDAIRSGSQGLSKDPYLARKMVRYWLPLGDGTHKVERAQDQLPGDEADQRIEFKAGFMSVADDFDKNRYANTARSQFENWSLFNDTAFDFAADTRGYTGGGVVTWVESAWQARLGLYQMPKHANGQELDGPLTHARGQYLEFTRQPSADGYAIRVLGFENTAKMGDYGEAIAIGSEDDTTPSIVANDKQYRRKYGAAVNGELPLFDGGDTGLFMRLGWNNGKTEDFAFTEMDRHASIGGQLSGAHWWRANDRLGVAYVLGGLSGAHRAYLADGGEGFVLGDGRITYGTEQVVEAYYRFTPWKFLQISPDLQYIRNPGFNSDRGPAFVTGFRLHLEY
jgi:hypothetical protein